MWLILKQGCGIGDDQYSVGYDGCRNLIWYNAFSIPTKQQTWKEVKFYYTSLIRLFWTLNYLAYFLGDVIGFLLDIENQKVCFYNNGNLIAPVHSDFFRKVK